MTEPEDIWRLCLDCAQHIYGLRKPRPHYVRRVAELLFGTAAKESWGFQFRRQKNMPWRGSHGGFSLWQVEQGSMITSMGYLRRREDVAERAREWLWRGEEVPPDSLTAMTQDGLLMLMRTCDRTGVLFARLHYLCVPESVPEGAGPQAAYWKKHFNTSEGSGTAEEYLEYWARFAPRVKALSQTQQGDGR